MGTSIRNHLPAIAAACILAACASAPVAHTELRADGSREAAGTLVDGLQEGEWTYWHPNGRESARGSYTKDVRSGTWTHWHENGALRMRGSYAGERQVGPWEFFHPNGALQCRGAFEAGREHGPWVHGHENGAVAQRGLYAHGKRMLQWEQFDASGRLVTRGSWYEDQPVGSWSQWSPRGAEQQLQYPVPPGMEHVVERWDDGTVKREGFLKDGVPHGPWLTRHHNGTPRAFVSFAQGVPAGELTTWREDGTELAQGTVAGASLTGRWRVRQADGAETGVDAALEPRAPWDRTWSEGSVAAAQTPLAVAGRWLDELASPRIATPVAPAVAARTVELDAAPQPREEAPTDPGAWTVSEREELDVLRRYYRDGRLPRRSGAADRYGGSAGAATLGSGDDALEGGIVGKALPVTSFPAADGTRLDLASLRGKRVLFVVLRGFTSQVCVYCFAQTAELAPLAKRWRELDCEVVVMFPGSRSRMQAFQQACASEFGDTAPPWRMVYDPDLELAQALGLQGNLARPASFVLDREGIVRHAYVAESAENAADRPSAAKLLEWVEAVR